MIAIALIGLGPHARRIYYPYVEDLINSKGKEFSFELVIDLEMNRDIIERFLAKRCIMPKHIIYLPSDGQIEPSQVHPLAKSALKQYRIQRVILSTEPKAHKIYLDECIKQSIPVVVDKPVTAPILHKNLLFPHKHTLANQITEDIDYLQNSILKHPGARVLVECQRRHHAGYRLVTDTLNNIVSSYQIPITYIDIHHSDGMWNMPDEFVYRENHPYKYGYGKLMHSGYHFVDLLYNLTSINLQLSEKIPDTLHIFSNFVSPLDQHATISQQEYARFFGHQQAEHFKSYMSESLLRHYGEIDSYSQLQYTRNKRVITTAQLSLMQSGFSRRAWPTLPEDAYKGNGRVRHESVNVHVGPLCSIQIHSYQAYEVNEQSGNPYSVGDKNHFDIYIFRNTALIGGQPFEHIRYGGYETMQHRSDGGYLGHNEAARHKILDELIYNLPSNSELASHVTTNRLLSAIIENHERQRANKIPLGNYKVKDFYP